MKLRKLNQHGVDAFRAFLADARRGTDSRLPEVPKMLLSLPTTSEEIADAPELDPSFYAATGYELALYLAEKFRGIQSLAIEGTDGRGDPGSWGAAALFYFELLTPEYPKSSKALKAESCYIPATGNEIALGRYFRHRLADPYRLYKLYGSQSQPLLLSSPGEQSTLYSKITDSMRRRSG